MLTIHPTKIGVNPIQPTGQHNTGDHNTGQHNTNILSVIPTIISQFLDNSEPVVIPPPTPPQPILEKIPPISIINNKIILETYNRKDIDLNLLYTPSYFETVNLDAKRVNLMKGGYFQKIDDLTFPYNNIVWLIEKNPVSIGIDKWLNQNANSSSDTNNYFQRITNFIKPLSDAVFETQSNRPEKVKESSEEPAQEEEEPGQDQEEEKQEEDQEEQGQEEEEQDQDQEEEPGQEEDQEGQEEDQDQEEEQGQEQGQDQYQDQEETIIKQNNVPSNPAKITIEIIKEKNIEHNGKVLKDILQECKSQPRTYETIDETGITYLLLERIVFDIYSQITFLHDNFNIVYSEFRYEYIYNINGKYVIFDVEKIAYLGNDKDNIVEKSKENNQLFSDFIQRLKFGESTFLQPANDTIIQNTNVEKLRNILLIS